MAPLETIRRTKLLSQRDLAERAGVAESTIHLIETGRSRNPRLKVMRALCEALGVTPFEVDEFHAALISAQEKLAA